jgi:hypothetical protein
MSAGLKSRATVRKPAEAGCHGSTVSSCRRYVCHDGYLCSFVVDWEPGWAGAVERASARLG